MIRIGLAAILLIVALILIVDDVGRSSAANSLTIASLGERWYAVHIQSLNNFQVGVERYVWPELWTYGFQPLLQGPAWLPFLLVGGLLMLWPSRRG